MIKQAQMDKLLDKLRTILRIEDWDIELAVMEDDVYQATHGKDFNYDTNGCTEINDMDSRAKIFLRDSLSKDVAYDTLLHECIHLVTHPYDSFVRDMLVHTDSRAMRKQMSKEALWRMEIAVSKFTTILKPLIKGAC